VRHSLRFRLAFTHVGMACFAIAVVALVVGLADAHRFAGYAQETQQHGTDAVLSALSTSYLPGIGWDARSVAAVSRLAHLNGLGLAVYDRAGSLLFSAGSPGMGMGTGMGSMMDGATGTSPAGAQRRTVAINVGGTSIANAVLSVPRAQALPLNSAYRRDVLLYLALAAAAAGGASIAVGLWTSRRISRPLVELTRAADAIAHGHREVGVSAAGSDEVAALARSFNLMATSLARQEEWRRTVTAELAHELRTPLATIQARVEAIEDGVLPADPRNLRVIGDEVERLGRLLSSLRRLDELDTGETVLHAVDVELSDFVADVCESNQAVYGQAGVTLSAHAAALTVSADPDRLRQVLANLLDNARKFTPPGGHVTLAVALDPAALPDAGQAVAISVSDDGPGVPAEELEHIFDRFYRARGAEQTEGVGLGLSISRQLVQAHGGAIEAACPSNGGLTVVIRLPLVSIDVPRGT
jgi:two-component system, OmpR family, sensor histidine kinase BaeS